MIKRKIPIHRAIVIKIEKEDFIAVAAGLIPLFIIAGIFRNNEVLCTCYTKWYAAIANTVLMCLEIMELIEGLKRNKTRVQSQTMENRQ